MVTPRTYTAQENIEWSLSTESMDKIIAEQMNQTRQEGWIRMYEICSSKEMLKEMGYEGSGAIKKYRLHLQQVHKDKGFGDKNFQNYRNEGQIYKIMRDANLPYASMPQVANVALQLYKQFCHFNKHNIRVMHIWLKALELAGGDPTKTKKYHVIEAFTILTGGEPDEETVAAAEAAEAAEAAAVAAAEIQRLKDEMEALDKQKVEEIAALKKEQDEAVALEKKKKDDEIDALKKELDESKKQRDEAAEVVAAEAAATEIQKLKDEIEKQKADMAEMEKKHQDDIEIRETETEKYLEKSLEEQTQHVENQLEEKLQEAKKRALPDDIREELEEARLWKKIIYGRRLGYHWNIEAQKYIKVSEYDLETAKTSMKNILKEEHARYNEPPNISEEAFDFFADEFAPYYQCHIGIDGLYAPDIFPSISHEEACKEFMGEENILVVEEDVVEEE